MSHTMLFTVLFLASGVVVGSLAICAPQRHAERLTGVMLIMFGCAILVPLFGVK